MRYLVGKKGDKLFLIRSSPEYPTFISAGDLREEDKIYIFGKVLSKKVGKLSTSIDTLDSILLKDMTTFISSYYDFIYIQFRVKFNTKIFKKVMLYSIESPIFSRYYKKEVENNEIITIKEDLSKELLYSYFKSKKFLPIKFKFKVRFWNYIALPSSVITLNIFISPKKKISYYFEKVKTGKLENKSVWTTFAEYPQSAKLITSRATEEVNTSSKKTYQTLGSELGSIVLAYKLKSAGVRTDSVKVSSSYSYKTSGRILTSLVHTQNQN